MKTVEVRSRPTRVIGERFWIYAAKGPSTALRAGGTGVWSLDLAMPGWELPDREKRTVNNQGEGDTREKWQGRRGQGRRGQSPIDQGEGDSHQLMRHEAMDRPHAVSAAFAAGSSSCR